MLNLDTDTLYMCANIFCKVNKNAPSLSCDYAAKFYFNMQMLINLTKVGNFSREN